MESYGLLYEKPVYTPTEPPGVSLQRLTNRRTGMKSQSTEGQNQTRAPGSKCGLRQQFTSILRYACLVE